jgi:hypothetical protein
MSEEGKEMVLIPKKELDELLQLKESLPLLLEQARKEGEMGRLKLLHQKAKENPEEHRQKALKRHG